MTKLKAFISIMVAVSSIAVAVLWSPSYADARWAVRGESNSNSLYQVRCHQLQLMVSTLKNAEISQLLLNFQLSLTKMKVHRSKAKRCQVG